MTKKFFTLATAIAFAISTSAQVRINEVMAQNNSGIADPDYGESADWVELYNAGTEDVDLSGWMVTDNLEDKTKYVLPEGTCIKANGYLLLWCDGNATGLHTGFKLSADGEEMGLFNRNGEQIDAMDFGPQYLDVSYGRMADDIDTWAFFSMPTPGAANTSEAFVDKANQPMILTRGGLFHGSVTVEITNDLGGTVHYTTDGSQPTASSPIYTNPLTFSKTTVLRACIIEEGKMPGNVMTETYFVDEAFEGHKLPVVSIATEEENFWDKDKGIYVQDFKPDWEVPVNIEMFLNNGSDRSAFNSPAGIKINGLYAWQLPQKMLGVYFKKKYGESKLEYQLFNDDGRSSFDNFALRASGSDWSYTLIRDGVMQQASRAGGMNLDLMAFRPCVVYVNGKFMGIHNIREKVDDDYVQQHYGLKADEIDMVEGGDTPEVGTTAAWDEFFAFAQTADLSDAANFAKLEEQFDVENFTDYIIAQSFCGNTSLSHNTMVWKPKAGGKWRWILMDTDRGFFKYDDSVIDYVVKRDYWPLKNMLKNAEYKRYFCQRLANQLFTTYNAENMRRQIDAHAADIAPLMDAHIERWKGTESSYGDAMPSVQYWHDAVDALRDFAYGRSSILLNDLSNYGAEKPALLALSAQPADACTWQFNGHKLSRSKWDGLYPKQMEIKLTAQKRAGYQFLGWRQTQMTNLVARGEDWKYLDNGSDQGEAWHSTDFDDSAWKTGTAPLGYGTSAVKTNVEYGSSSKRHITTYFRRHFTLDTTPQDIRSVRLHLLREDGAVVYLNGEKVLSTNMPLEGVNYKTKSHQALDDLARKRYVVFEIPTSALRQGDNVLAVEVHQCASNSSDLSFDCQVQIETLAADAPLLGSDETLNFKLSDDMGVCAMYEPTGENIVPADIFADYILYKEKSPYLVPTDVTVHEGARLTIQPGVTLLFSPNVNMYIHGAMTADGTEEERIKFMPPLTPPTGGEPHPDGTSPQLGGMRGAWGSLSFIHTGDAVSSISYADIIGASRGPAEYNCVAAISGFGTKLMLDHIDITNVEANPIAVRYSDLRLTNSRLHSKITGDLTNVKYGKGYIADCEFIGNDMPDTDAIDYDGVTGGVIRRVTAHDFLGSNSDAIDIGEQAMAVLIDSIKVYNVTDKGISIGQRSTCRVTNSTFVQTNLGLGVKDSCRAEIDRCTFYSVQTPIASYEKVAGRAGGNVNVTRSIFSNSFDQDVECDAKSTVRISQSLTDAADAPLAGDGNINADPQFAAPSLYDLTPNNTEWGSPFRGTLGCDIEPLITHICYAPIESLGETEFITLHNPGDESIDLCGYTFNKGIEFTFPEGFTLEAHSDIIVAKTQFDTTTPLFAWSSGKLANEGETIELTNPHGIVVDQVRYLPTAPWPVIADNTPHIIALADVLKANNIASNWQFDSSTAIATPTTSTDSTTLRAYDLQGRPVNPRTHRGIMIIGEKKVWRESVK